VRRSLERDGQLGSTKGATSTGRRVDVGPVLLTALANEHAIAAEHDLAQHHALVFPAPDADRSRPRHPCHGRDMAPAATVSRDQENPAPAGFS
jgi:hypothetical protein